GEVEKVIRNDVGAPDAQKFARELIAGVRDHGAEIDRVVEGAAINWKLRRMAVIDRNILRMGCFELLHRPDLPPAVTINEAVLLAKKYSTAESGAFVNGILDKVHQSHRRGGDAAAGVAADDDAGDDGIADDDAAPVAADDDLGADAGE
ncbi:MAG: transcription antitermination factor NusB, partial [Planctomycetes bacterium]|nr:transcription antitermination factor NusB [Planctomycetota bacterium]